MKFLKKHFNKKYDKIKALFTRENPMVSDSAETRSGSTFTNHSQEHFLSFTPRFEDFNVIERLTG